MQGRIFYSTALPHEAKAIVKLIEPSTTTGAVLPRTEEDVLEHIDNFFVAKWIPSDDVHVDEAEVVGCVALRDFGGGLEEVRTLCVNQKFSGFGIASKLIQHCFKLARSRHAKQIFALSLRPNLFVRQGFQHISMDRLPERVWKDDQVSSPDEKAVILIDFDELYDC